MIHRIISGIVSRLRNLYWKSRGVRIRGYCRLGRIDILREHRALEFEKEVALEDGCSFIISSIEGRSPPRLKVGANSYFNRGVILDACELLTIGQSVMIGPNSYITDHDHALKGDRSDLISQPTCIEDAVWIGANVCILKGVTVGAGSVIGAGSVVTKSVPPNCLAVGNPAKVVREL